MKNMFVKEAWDFLEKNPLAVLIDVRTSHEWAMIGFPDLTVLGRQALALTWNPGEKAAFGARLEAEVPDRNTPLLFLCRSGARSHAAGELAEASGYQYVINICDGFEDGHGPGTGWRAGGFAFTLRPLGVE